MRIIRLIVIIIFLAMISIYFVKEYNLLSKNKIEEITYVLQPKEHEVKSKKIPDKREISNTFKGDLFQWMGKSVEELEEAMGKPVRKDLSAYGYNWWVYSDLEDQYIQFGVMDKEIVSIFATGENLASEPIQIGQSYDVINNKLSFETEVGYREGISTYHFQLSKDDMNLRPLVKISKNVFAQLYFDTFTNKLSSIRILNGDVLLQHSPYQLEYRGSLSEPNELSQEDWLKVEEGMEQQIFDLTNIFRIFHDKETLGWEEAASEVAFMHSKDMEENNYFSHYNPDGDGLKERLAQLDIAYFSAGENIAAMYPDAPAAMEGWLNSEGHREALLNDNYTHLGVGVYRLYYTQNFLEKP